MLGFARCCLCSKIRRKKSMLRYQEPFFTQWYEKSCLLSPCELPNEKTRQILLQYKDETENLTEKNLRAVHKLKFAPARKRRIKESGEDINDEVMVGEEEPIKIKKESGQMAPKDLVKALKAECEREGISFPEMVQELIEMEKDLNK